ncbi:MAG: tRNA (adenosine(37)-N6)-dimethylallyltransferase MiaA [Solidesulfovibrio sp.]|uniref:tRNA (adenosine(37)-N6)-dimethylallyltransferase MiaA n=1 Tax=Solidesulfovibrio sp. TaxID=2910990 RepID=UPI002B200DBD|nr:tRNA (adenosine(37)-N6)-dimethylallyltransferase MiaA [Solidesulfovibrio sp.]MEA4858384.1 tRNA (adenosine(37)-N6)-dimethylallyltransferase MiaA [Solidesulfovibrio sp.]
MAGPKVVCLMGATGTGKTGAALALAEAFGGAVVNVDSRQVYMGLAVLTAQPTPEERARCPHFLYGDTPLDRAVSAGAYARRARCVVASILERGMLPLLVGGTGLYFRAIRGGLAPIPAVPAEVRNEIVRDYDRLGPAAMHAKLSAIDPDAAARIAPADRQRLTRALEVAAATGRTLTSWHAQGDPEAPDYDVLALGLHLPLETLAPRLARRIEAMAAGGAVEEVRRALARHPADAPGLSGIGGPELAAHLAGQTSLGAAKAAWLANTRAYAKRQMTWFRKEPDVRWFAPDDTEGLLAAVAAWRNGEAA